MIYYVSIVEGTASSGNGVVFRLLVTEARKVQRYCGVTVGVAER